MKGCKTVYLHGIKCVSDAMFVRDLFNGNRIVYDQCA